MTDTELEVLDRARRLFAARPQSMTLESGSERYADLLARTATADIGGEHARYRQEVRSQRVRLLANARVDAAATAILAAAIADHAQARQQTGAVVTAARADAAAIPDTALAHREAMRRQAARLRAQRAHVLAARRRAQMHRAGLRRLRYRGARRRLADVRNRLPLSNTHAGMAVRAALSRLGRPYVWGATGPDRFDCSGLTQWAYHQAGVPLSRTTYTQILEGVPVARNEVRPGDLVFPSTGHVQMAIGNNLVVEAPHAGASVRISPLGPHIAIRRPMS